MYRLGAHLKEGGFHYVPSVLVELERYAKLPITARLVVRDLFLIAHRVSSPRFYAKESTLRKMLHLDRKTLRAALTALVVAGLLQLKAANRGEPWEFWLRNPTTGALLPEQDGRATPTFNGVSKGRWSQTMAIAERRQTATQSREQPKRKAPEQPTASPTRSDHASLPPVVPLQIPARTKRLCHIPNHKTIHYRLDGSEVCGDCHPTGITVPPSAGFSEPHKSPTPVTPQLHRNSVSRRGNFSPL
jgi:hypothetical protein